MTVSMYRHSQFYCLLLFYATLPSFFVVFTFNQHIRSACSLVAFWKCVCCFGHFEREEQKNFLCIIIGFHFFGFKNSRIFFFLFSHGVMHYLVGVVFMCLFQSTIVGVLAGQWISCLLLLNEQVNSIKNVFWCFHGSL